MRTKLKTIALIAALSMAMILLPACQSEVPLTAADYLSLGEKFLLELDYEQAVVQFLKVIEIEPMNPRGYTGAAEAYIALGEIDEAIDVLREGLEALPDNEEIQDLADELETAEEDDDNDGEESPEASEPPSEGPSTGSTPQQTGDPSTEPSDDNSLGTFTVLGTFVHDDLDWQNDEKFQAYIEEYGTENVGTYVGISFAEPLILPSGETINTAIPSRRTDIMPDDEWNALVNSGSSHTFTGRLEYDENLVELITPGTLNNEDYIYNPWGPYRFVIEGVDP